MVAAGIDNQGAGRSGGLFGHITHFSHQADDVMQLCKILQASAAPDGFGAGIPMFGVGVSLGGGIVLQAALRKVRASREGRAGSRISVSAGTGVHRCVWQLPGLSK